MENLEITILEQLSIPNPYEIKMKIKFPSFFKK